MSSIRARLPSRVPVALTEPTTILPLLLIAAFVARGAWLALPPGGLIFDESYYVNAARILLGWAVAPGAPYAGSPIGLDPNTEHPPLGKVLIAGSMLLFGDNGVGWRLPSLIAGMVSLGALYGIVRAAGETAALATLAVAFFAFDNLSLVHSRMGTLDMLSLAPVLVAAWLGLRDRWIPAGALLALGFLVKITAVYGLLALLLLIGLRTLETWSREHRIDRTDVRAVVQLLVVFGVIAFAGLWLLDARFSSFASPLDHLRHMVQYGASLRESIEHGGICVGVSSTPWQWPFNTCQINYLRVDVTIRDAAGLATTGASIDFRGALNPLLASAIPIAALFVFWLAWTAGDRLSRWCVVWIAANWLPYVVLVLVNNRVTYLYYFLPVVPALAAAVAVLLLRSALPRFVAAGYVVAYAMGFLAYYPFRQIP